jgi:hypothetical protein
MESDSTPVEEYEYTQWPRQKRNMRSRNVLVMGMETTRLQQAARVKRSGTGSCMTVLKDELGKFSAALDTVLCLLTNPLSS